MYRKVCLPLSKTSECCLDDEVSHVALQVKADHQRGVAAVAALDGLVAGGCGDEVELAELHVAGNVHSPACSPAVGDVLGGVADCGYKNEEESTTEPDRPGASLPTNQIADALM